MAYRALKEAGLAFDLIRAADIQNGYLVNYAMLFVPGGWSSNKMKALGDKGVERIKEFAANGGNYLGFCGGAGLATLDGIGLLKIRRKPTKDRIPSFSGRIRLKLNDHEIWSGTTDLLPDDQSPHIAPAFHAWWPPQFTIEDKHIKILASYGEPLPDSFSSDLNIGDVQGRGGWADLEHLYRINLDPKRLLDDPAVVEGSYGSGRVLLSLVHFDTLADINGFQVLRNIWEYLGGQKEPSSSSYNKDRINTDLAGNSSLQGISELESTVSGIIELGIRNFLWFWRNPMLLQWRRGVRGLEYCTLFIMIREIALQLKNDPSAENSHLERSIMDIGNRLIHFSERAKRLLVFERLAMQSGHITYERCDDPEIQNIREELFSTSKSYGGLFKEIIDSIDALLYLLITLEQDI